MCWGRECRPTSIALKLSMEYLDPASGSIILKIACTIEDLPAPVLPTIPILENLGTLKEIFVRQSGS